eukprot:m51a1_g10873 hypothetical protein (1102) ;mRNA; f:3428-7717
MALSELRRLCAKAPRALNLDSLPSDLDRVVMLCRSTKPPDRDAAVSLLATAALDPRNHAMLRERRAVVDLLDEFARLSPSLLPTCLSAVVSLAASDENKAALREAGACSMLVSLLFNPVAVRLREQALRGLALLMTGNPPIAKEVADANGVTGMATALRECLSVGGTEGALANSLWALAAVSLAPASHQALMAQGVLEMMGNVLSATSSLIFCDYALSCLLQLTVREDCRKTIVGYNLHQVMMFRMTCGHPSVVRRCFQILGNLCVDESSRVAITSMPQMFPTVIACITDPKADIRMVIQAMKLLSNLVQSDVESRLFCNSGGVQWLVATIQRVAMSSLQPPVVVVARTPSPRISPTCQMALPRPCVSPRPGVVECTEQTVFEGQAVVLLATLLLYDDVQRLWLASGGADLLMQLLDSPQLIIKREVGRAVSNLASLDDDCREAMFKVGLSAAFVRLLGVSPPEDADLKQFFQVHLSILRALASLTFNLQRSSEVLYIGILDELAKLLAKRYSPEDQIILASLTLSVLSNLTAITDAKVIILSHAKISAWLVGQLAHTEQSVQLHAVRLLTRLATNNEGRKWINESPVIMQKLQSLAEMQTPNKHLKMYAQMARDVAMYPYDSGKIAQRIQTADEEDKTAKRLEQRAKRRALTLTGTQLASVAKGGGVVDTAVHPHSVPATTPRQKCLQEFCLRLRDYLTWRYIRPLLAFSGLIPAGRPGSVSTSAIRTIFGNSESISIHAATLLDVLESRVWAPDCTVADALASYFANVTALYVRYAESFAASVAVLAETRRHCGPLAAFMRKCEAAGCPLMPLLLLPLQRGPEYTGFLASLAAATPADHADRQPVLDAAQQVQAMACALEQERRECSSLEQLMQIETMLFGEYETLVAKGRRVVHEGRLLLAQFGASPLGTRTDIHAVLLSDLLVLSRPNPAGGYTYLDRIPLAECTVFASDDDPAVPEAQRASFRLQKLAAVGGTKVVLAFVFAAESPHECAQWVALIAAQKREAQASAAPTSCGSIAMGKAPPASLSRSMSALALTGGSAGVSSVDPVLAMSDGLLRFAGSPGTQLATPVSGQLQNPVVLPPVPSFGGTLGADFRLK